MNTNDKNNAIKLFNEHKIRTIWDNEKEQWYFSIVDIVAILTDSTEPRKYWSVLKTRLKKEGSELTTICSQLKMQAVDGKFYKTDALDTQGVLRLIQSIPSPKAEPFKLWLARIGSERIDETNDPELAIDRALKTYLSKGYSPEWVNQRLKSIEVRKGLTDEWKSKGVQNSQYGLLTDILTKEWSGYKVKEYKEHKGLKKENLRDNMSNLELVLNMLAEVSTTEISRQKDPNSLKEHIDVAKEGGSVAKNARLNLEQKTGKKIVSEQNAKNMKQIKNED